MRDCNIECRGSNTYLTESGECRPTLVCHWPYNNYFMQLVASTILQMK